MQWGRPARAHCISALVVASLFTLSTRAESIVVDRVVVRFDAPEAGGPAHPQFILERELAFEARLEALADANRADRSRPYLDRHVRAALERHIAEELLAHLAMDPEPSATEIETRAKFARAVLEQRVGGGEALVAARRARGSMRAKSMA